MEVPRNFRSRFNQKFEQFSDLIVLQETSNTDLKLLIRLTAFIQLSTERPSTNRRLAGITNQRGN